MSLLYSVVLELTALNPAVIPATMGHQAHALFLDLVRQVDLSLAARLHDEPNYRPFTVSPLSGGHFEGATLVLRSGQSCRLRFTLLDGGPLWQTLTQRFLATPALTLRLGNAQFRLERMLTTPKSDPDGWAGFTDWTSLAAIPARMTFQFRFVSPTAFSRNDGNEKRFLLFPEPVELWASLRRSWNLYAPEGLRLDKPTWLDLQKFIEQRVLVTDYELQTATLYFPNYLQKGFTGFCGYKVSGSEAINSLQVAQLTALAEYSLYCGTGYKTTMGMGQTHPV
jgi:CRISPR-associated endoribonuclease Cas6